MTARMGQSPSAVGRRVNIARGWQMSGFSLPQRERVCEVSWWIDYLGKPREDFYAEVRRRFPEARATDGLGQWGG